MIVNINLFFSENTNITQEEKICILTSVYLTNNNITYYIIIRSLNFYSAFPTMVRLYHSLVSALTIGSIPCQFVLAVNPNTGHSSLLQRSSVSVPDDIKDDLKQNIVVDEDSGNASVGATVNAVIGGELDSKY